MERIARSFRLTVQAYRVLMQDRELMVLPLIAGVVIVACAASFFLVFGINSDPLGRDRAQAIVPVFLLYVVTYAVGIFFQAAVVAGATERLRGGDPTVGSALAAASRRLVPILMWSLVAATVGTLLRAIQDRSAFVGRIVVGLLGAAWSLATFFIVPVLVLEERSIGDSFGQSWRVFKKTWGETVVGSVGVGIAAFCGWVTLIAIVGLLAWAGAGVIALIAFALGAILLLIFFSALQGVYVASLYRFATEGHEPPGFDADLLAHAFVPKRPS